MSILSIVGAVLVALAAIFHIYIFTLESISWSRPKTWRIFGIASQADADTIKPMALNQGFYNLFLALGALVGVGIVWVCPPAGLALIFSAAGSMVLAGVVLAISSPRSRRAALMQAGPPFVGIVLVLLSLLP